MSTSGKRASAAKSPLKLLQERQGGVSKQLVEHNRQQRAVRQKLVDALRGGPKTVPELAQATGLTRHEVFWHLMSMKKYGKLVEGQQREGYFEYALAAEPEQTETHRESHG